ncbi:Mss4-like protein [Ascosphaera apis ARSEF 7405]|uniref:Mss4-like protein n=1 Tax=Ascosphaera apis ARSEF 7405 TaxID=392613 RepID=A0A167WC70_9EURO|nr:Mss4-like protein [Ascosphaera apis ARSEF 7405]
MATTAGKSTQQQQTTPASPAAVTHLHGSCSCGRNQYVVSIPLEQREYAAVYFDNGSDGRLTNGAPITAFLRIPLTWYSSSTYAYTPQESPSSIRRVFAPHDANPYARRTFCGYCGTPLTYWTEQPDGEGGFMSVTVGSLRGRDQEKRARRRWSRGCAR